MLVRFNSDEMVETWLNDKVMVTSFETVELLEEKSVTITDLTKLESTDGETAFEVCTEPTASDACDDDAGDYAADLKLVGYENFEIGTVYTNGELPPPDPGEADGYIPNASSSPEWDGEIPYLSAGVWQATTGPGDVMSHRGYRVNGISIEKRPAPDCDYVLTIRYLSSYSPGGFNYSPTHSVIAWRGVKPTAGGPEGFYYAESTNPAIPFTDQHDFFEVRRV